MTNLQWALAGVREPACGKTRPRGTVCCELPPDHTWNCMGRSRSGSWLNLGFLAWPRVGEVVCDCRFKHLKVKERLEYDDVVLEDGFHASIPDCLDPADHPEESHQAEVQAWLKQNSECRPHGNNSAPRQS